MDINKNVYIMYIMRKYDLGKIQIIVCVCVCVCVRVCGGGGGEAGGEGM